MGTQLRWRDLFFGSLVSVFFQFTGAAGPTGPVGPVGPFEPTGSAGIKGSGAFLVSHSIPSGVLT